MDLLSGASFSNAPIINRIQNRGFNSFAVNMTNYRLKQCTSLAWTCTFILQVLLQTCEQHETHTNLGRFRKRQAPCLCLDPQHAL